MRTVAKNSGNETTVLIVEDDDDMAALMRLILEKDAWTVLRAVDGKGAKELISGLAPPALVTLDIFLPDTSGVDLILHIRDTPGWEQVPIVMVTAKPKDKDVNWAIKSGATAYLAKPFKQEELRDCVRRVALVKEDSMSEMAKKKRAPRKEDMPSSKGHEKAMDRKPSRSVKDQQNDSDAIERAVYDGMQDLRADKTK